MKNQKNPVLKASRKVMALGILTALLGVAAMVYPSTAGNITAAAVGVFMVIGGIIRLSVAGVSVSWKATAASVFYGLIMLAAGVYVLANPNIGLDALTLMMAAYFVIDGATQMYYAFKLQPMGGGTYLLTNGLLSLVLGGLIFAKYPESSLYAIGIYLGIKLIVDGLTIAITAGKIAQYAKSTGKTVAEIREAFMKEYEAFVAEQEKYKEEHIAKSA